MTVLYQNTLYKNHGKAIGFWEIQAYDDGRVITQHAKTLTDKPVKSTYRAIAKNVGKANQTSPGEQAVLEAQSKARLKVDKGYVQNKDEANTPATNALGLKRPMLATPIEKVKLADEHFEKHYCFVQPKLDGHRALWCPESKTLYSRQGKPLDIPHIEEALKNSPLGELHLDGELYAHGESLQNISRLVKKYREGQSEIINFHIYDHIAPQEFKLRMDALLVTEADCDQRCLEVVNTLPVYSMDAVTKCHRIHRDNGYEGTMLRISGNGYEDGKRSRALLKIKEFHDAEFLITGCMPGKEVILNDRVLKPAVWICQTKEGKEFNVLAQGDALAKHEQFIDRNQYIGRYLTVKYHYLSEDGVPQLPVALRFKENL